MKATTTPSLTSPNQVKKNAGRFSDGQRAHVARAQAAGEGGVGHLVGPGIHLGIAEALVAIQEEGALALAARHLLDAVGQGVQVGGLDQRAGGRAAVQTRLGKLAGHAALVRINEIRWCIVCAHARVSPVYGAGCGGRGCQRPCSLFRCPSFACPGCATSSGKTKHAGIPRSWSERTMPRHAGPEEHQSRSPPLGRLMTRRHER
jgi:hypothetical protein